MRSRPTVIVLAAGRGARFLGADHKLVQSLGTGTVLGTTLRHVIVSGLPMVVVTTDGLADLARRSVAARDVVLLPEVGSPDGSLLGMGYSIATGVSARPDASGWLVLPADMPMVQPQTLQALASHMEDHPVVYAQYKGRRGHPVGFDAEIYSELVVLTGDDGARRLVGRYPAIGVEVDDPGVLIDVDTEADLEQLRQAPLESLGDFVRR